MVAKFDQWLAKPSTLHLLRSFLTVGEVRTRRPCCHWKSSLGHGTIRRKSEFSAFKRLRIENEDHEKENERRGGDGTEQLAEGATSSTGEPLDVDSLNLQLSVAGVVIMDKAIYTNKSFPELRRQANVNSDHELGKLLIDDPANKDNSELWAEILQFRQRLDGLDGVVDVWRGMRKRSFHLPVQGDKADILWTTFVRATLSVEHRNDVPFLEFLDEIFEYAVDSKTRTGLHYDELYKCIIGSLLRSSFPEAGRNVFVWSTRLSDAGFRSREGISKIIEDVLMSPRRGRSLNWFKKMYLTCGHRDLYDSCIREALGAGDEAAALGLHQIFLSKGDEPSPEMLATPEVQRLFQLDQDKNLPLKKASEIRDMRIQPRKFQSVKWQLERMRSSLGPTALDGLPGIKKEKKLSDHFCARLIATRAFSVGFVIHALSMLGVEELGPLAVRELALRTGSVIEFSNTLKDIETRDMRLTSHIYCQLVSRISNDNVTPIWDVLLASDQHPESFADTVTQQALLAMFLSKHQWADAHLSLLALSLSGVNGPGQGWNVVLQHYVQHHEFHPMLSAFQSMQSQGVPLSPKSVHDIYWYVLPERERGKRYAKGRVSLFLDPLNFVAKAFMYASEQGAIVPHRKWLELLKRLGMNHQWDSVERLVLWLMDHYSFDNSARLLGLSKDLYLHRKRIVYRTMMIRRVFTPNMRKALVAWGFRSASVRHQLRFIPFNENETEVQDTSALELQCEPWAQGLALFKTMNARDPYFSIRDAREAFKLRMWILFGPAYSTLGLNNEARRTNQLSLAHYIRHADEVWPGIAHILDPALFRDRADRPRHLYFAFFGAFKRVSRKRREYVDVGAWLQSSALLPSPHSIEKRLVPAKQAAWRRIGFPIRQIILSSKEAHLLTRPRPSGRRFPKRQSPVARAENWHLGPSPLYNLG